MGRVKAEVAKCTGCSLCELACSVAKEKVFNPGKARIKVAKEGLPAQVAILVCAQCKRAACAESCPTDAITLRNDTGAWVVDEKLCVGCGLCVEVCAFDAIWLHPATGVAIKCDLCDGKPECVARCPKDVLSLQLPKPPKSTRAKETIKRNLEQKGLSGDQFLID
jgi:Fe-S-cluster-containing hydrogenase component 2